MKNGTFNLMIGLILLTIITLFLWLNSWQPVHAICYLNEDLTPTDHFNGERYDYLGKQKVIDRFWDTEGGKISMRGAVLKLHNDKIELTSANRIWLHDECTKN